MGYVESYQEITITLRQNRPMNESSLGNLE
jgi:hypothetical protein